MEITPRLIRDEKLQTLKAKYSKIVYPVHERELNVRSDCQEFIGHILAQDKFIEELLQYRASLQRIACKAGNIGLGTLYRDSADMLEKLINERFDKVESQSAKFRSDNF